MCVTFLGRFYDSLKEGSVKFDQVEIEKAMLRSCKDAKGKENRFVSRLRAPPPVKGRYQRRPSLMAAAGAPGEEPREPGWTWSSSSRLFKDPRCLRVSC